MPLDIDDDCALEPKRSPRPSLHHIAATLSPRTSNGDYPPDIEDIPRLTSEPSPAASLECIGAHLSPRQSGGDFLPNFENVDAKPPTPSSSSEPARFLQLHAHLAFFGIFGLLARLGLNALTAYPGAPIDRVIWANFAGCVVMGILVSEETQHVFGRGSRALYTGLTTGFCGSLTSFSSFEYDAFRYLANVLPTYAHESRGYSFMALVAYVIATFALSLGGLQFGAHLAHLFVLQKFAVKRPLATVTKAVDWGVVPLAAACWVAAVVMCVFIPRWQGHVLFACVFAPIGVFARFWVSRALNPKVKRFPLGTFTANIVATLVLAGMGIGRARHAGPGCRVVMGVADGFCGCLSTVSTFVTELRGLRTSQAYIYAVVSVGLGLAIMVVVLGCWVWTKGGLEQMC